MEITHMLRSIQQGERGARNDLIEAAYDDLRRLAAKKMTNERKHHTFSVTELVNEVSVKILSGKVPVESRGRFFAYAYKAMNNLLIDHARRRGRLKRGGDRKTEPLDENFVAEDDRCERLAALNRALERLSEVKPRAARVVNLRHFGGLSNREIAATLGVSPATVKREWIAAKAWLLKALWQR